MGKLTECKWGQTVLLHDDLDSLQMLIISKGFDGLRVSLTLLRSV